MNNDNLIKILIPPKLKLSDKAHNPAFDIPQYEYKTIASFRKERETEFLKSHQKASALIVNQNGTPLYALYVSPQAQHEEAVAHLFKTLRAQKYNDWELELLESNKEEKI